MRNFLALILSFCILHAYAQDGILDNTFGNGGKIFFESDNINTQGSCVAIQRDGKIVVAGSYSATPSGESNFIVMRLQPNGLLDYSFGTNGKVVIKTDNIRDNTKGIAIQEDGKIVLGGTSERKINGSGNIKPHFAVLRLLPNGSLDKSFNGTGQVYTYFETDYGYSRTLAIQKDGRILIAGQINSDGGLLNWDAAIVRLHTNGSLDSSFGINGKVVNIRNNNRNEEIWSLDFQEDGTIVGSGLIGNSYTTKFALYRYHLNGSLDSSFGDNGIVITTTNSTPNIHTGEVASSIKVQKDKKITTAGFYQTQYLRPIILRYNSSGKLDSTFGKNGMTDLPGFGDIRQLLLQNDRKIVAIGTSFTPPNDHKIMVLRLKENGDLDSTFGTDGKTLIENSMGFSSAFQGKKIILTGTSYTSDWLVARLNNSIDPSSTSLVKEILLYPSPAKKFKLKFSGYDENVTINMYDLLGRLISQQRAEVIDQSIIEFNTQYLASSIYLIVVYTKSGIVVKRFVKQ